MLDPVYMGKTIYTLFNLLRGRKPILEYEKETTDFASQLRGKSILIVHTGGQLANFDAHRYDDYLMAHHRKHIYDCFGEKIDSIKL